MEKYYAILGLKPGASASEIRKAYRTLAKRYHPDKNHGDPAAAEKFKEINEAYHALVSPNVKSKSTWSTWADTGKNDGSKKQNGFGGQDFKDMYDNMFKHRYRTYGGPNVGDEQFGFDKSNYGGRNVVDNNIYVDTECTLTEMLTKGIDMSASVDRKVMCTACGGKQKVCPECGGRYPNRSGCGTCGGAGIVKCKYCGGTGFIILNKKVAISLDVRKTPVKINRGDNSHYALLRFAGIGNQGLDFGGKVITGDMYFRMKITGVPEGVSFDGGDILQHVDMTLIDFLRGVVINKITHATHDISGMQLDEYGNVAARIRGGGIAKDLDGNVGDYVFNIRVRLPNFAKLSESDKVKMVELLEKL